MGTKIKYAIYVLAAAVLFVPVALTGFVEAEDVCYELDGSSTENANTGSITPDSLCVDISGNITGTFESDNIGTLYLEHDHPSYTNASVDLDAEGDVVYWEGYLYAPLNAYDFPYSYGTAFDLSTVYTDLSDGSVYGCATSPNLGELCFEGITQDLPPVYLTASVSVGTFGNVAGGSPVADMESGYRVFVTVDSYGDSYDLDPDDFSLSGEVTESETSNMCFDQVDGTCGDTEAISHSSDFSYYGQDGDALVYYYDIKSYAPTSGALCNYMGDYENCLSPDTSNSYGISTVEIEGVMGRDFVWYYGGAEQEGSTLEMAASTSLSFAPPYEIDDLYPIDMDLDTVTNVSVGETYDFEPSFIKNGEYFAGYDLEIIYSVDDTNYSFGDIASETDEFVLSGPTIGSLASEDAFDEIGLWTSDDETELVEGSVASVVTYIGVNVEGQAVYYPGQNFFFADLMAGVAEPRIGVIGTVSGLVEEDDVTVVGDVDRMELRDVVFEQVMKVIRGISSTGGSGGTIYSDWTVSSGCESLVSGDVLYCTGSGAGDVVIIKGGDISETTFKTILIVGADAYIANNIEKTGDDGGIGIIVLEDDGYGGNLYVDDGVTDLHVNMFLDGSLMRADASGDTYSESQLTDQLYILGSVISQNTIGGVDAEDGPVCGDGNSCTTEQAKLYDFGYMSYFQVCYPYTVNPDGTVEVDTGSYEYCDDYNPSSYEGDYGRQAVIIEYSSPSENLPVFNVSGSVVR